MPSLSEEITIPAPLEMVWPLLRDPVIVSSCIPGATLTETGEGGAYRGALSVKLGKELTIFRGEVTLSYDDDTHLCRISGRAVDGRKNSRAVTAGEAIASGTDTTTLRVTGMFTVMGRLESIAETIGVDLAREMLVEFGRNLSLLIGPQGETVPADETGTLVEPVGMPSRQDPAPAVIEPVARELPQTGVPGRRNTRSWLRQLLGRET